MTERAVYIVDDEEAIRRSLELTLETAAYAPRSFAGGTQLLEAESDLPAGCVLLDLRMPDIDGLEVQRRLLAAASPHAVIVMSGHGELGAAITAMEQGAIAFLEKPFSRVTLLELLDIAFLRLDESVAYQVYLRAAATAVGQLADQDRTVLDLLVRGHDLASVAAQTGAPQAALDIARSRIFQQLGAPSLAAALRIAFAARRAATL